MADRGYTASKEQLNKRLARIEGQVRGVSRWSSDDRYCIDVLTQIGAIQAALDKVALGLLDGHARHCLLGEGAGPERAGRAGRRADGRRRPAHAPRLAARSPRRRRSSRRRRSVRAGRAEVARGGLQPPLDRGRRWASFPSTPDAIISAAVAETCGAAIDVPT